MVAFTLTLCMFSIAGAPPLAGFYSEAFLFFAALGSNLYLPGCLMNINWIHPPDSRGLNVFVEGASMVMYYAIINLLQMYKLFCVIIVAMFVPACHRSELYCTVLGYSSRRLCQSYAVFAA